MTVENFAKWTPPQKPDLKGIYHHRKHDTYLRVLGNTKSHIVVKWGDTEVVRSVDYLSDYAKMEKMGTSKLLH